MRASKFGDSQPLGSSVTESLAVPEWGIEVGEPLDLAEHARRLSILGALPSRVGPVEEYTGDQFRIHGPHFFDQPGNLSQSPNVEAAGNNGNEQKLRDRQSCPLAGRVTAPSIHDDVVVLGNEFEDFSADDFTAELGASVAWCRWVVFLADRSKIGCGFLIVGVDEQDIGILTSGNTDKVRGDGGFSATAFDPAHS